MKNSGGPAFPWGEPFVNPPTSGMSLRDYFAIKALQGIISKQRVEMTDQRLSEMVMQNVRGAYDYADAMLAEREKE